MSAKRNPYAYRMILGVSLFILCFPMGSIWARPTKPTIAFTGFDRAKAKWDIYTMDIDGHNVRKLTDERYNYMNPSWSPDGTRILCKAIEQKGKLAIIDCNGSNLQWIATGEVSPHFDLQWSPDGTQVAFTAHIAPDKANDIYVLDLLTGMIRQVTNNRYTDENPSWSPDSQWIIFSSNQDPNFWLPLGGGQLASSADLYIMDKEGNNLRNLTQTFRHEWLPSWSPDGSQIAFVMSIGVNTDQLNVMSASGGRRQQLTHFKGNYFIMSTSWSPDGQYILFSVLFPDKNGEDIFLIRPDGTNLRQLTDHFNFWARHPRLFGSTLAVSPVSKQVTTWGEIKRKYQ
jgi:TolB protein